MDNIKIYKSHFAFSPRYDLCDVTHKHTYTHTDRQRNWKAPGYRLNPADLPKMYIEYYIMLECQKVNETIIICNCSQLSKINGV